MRLLEKLEELYRKYPRKVGKSKGLKKLLREVKSEEDLILLEQAILNYRTECMESGRPPIYIKHFSTFATEWRDWVEIEQSEDFSCVTTDFASIVKNLKRD